MTSLRTLLALPFLAAVAHADISRVLEFRYSGDTVKELHLATFGGSIEVTTTQDKDILIEAHEKISVNTEEEAAKIRGRYTLTSGEKDGTASVEARQQGSQGWFGNKINVRLVAKIPESLNLRLATSGGRIQVGDLSGTLNAETSGGSIELGVMRNEARVETSGGKIVVKASERLLLAETSGGKIIVDKAAGRTELRTSGGSIRVGAASGGIQASTSGGSVEVIFDTEQPLASELETAGGSVTAFVPKGVNCRIDLATAGGGASTDLPVLLDEGKKRRSELRGQLGKGGETLRLRSSGGSVAVRSL